MQKWEYWTENLEDYNNRGNFQTQLRRIGSKGWELIQIVDSIAYFKRPVDEAARNRERITWSEDVGWSMKEDADLEKYKEFAKERILQAIDKMNLEERFPDNDIAYRALLGYDSESP